MKIVGRMSSLSISKNIKTSPEALFIKNLIKTVDINKILIFSFPKYYIIYMNYAVNTKEKNNKQKVVCTYV